MSENSSAIKRTIPDVVTEPSPPNSKRLKVTHSPETSSRRDARKRKKRRKKAPVVAKPDGRQDSSPQPRRPSVSACNEIIRFTSVEPSGSKTNIGALSRSTTTVSNSSSHESTGEMDSGGNSQAGNLEASTIPETIENDDMEQPQNLPQPLCAVPGDRTSQLTKELAERDDLLAAHRGVLNNISQALTCQICLDIMYKPYALAPCGHIACYDCLVQWFNAPPVDNHPAPPAVVRKKTCPHCRAVVRERPAEIWTIKNLAHVITKSGLLSVPPHDKSEASTDRPVDNDPWEGIFRKPGHSCLPWFHADDTDPEPRRGEDVGMLDVEDGGIYRCLDCMHEIWDGICTACGRHYPGHGGGGDWSDDELGLDFTPGVEELDADDDPGWMGLEGGEGDDEDDGLAIADWYPGLPLFRSTRFHMWMGEGEDEDEDGDDEDGDEADLDDAAYESDFIDDEDDTGIPREPMQDLPYIYEVADESDDDDSRSHVDADTLSEDEDELDVTRRRGQTGPIIVSSDEDEDVRSIPFRLRRGRLVESDDEAQGSSDGSSHS